MAAALQVGAPVLTESRQAFAWAAGASTGGHCSGMPARLLAPPAYALVCPPSCPDPLNPPPPCCHPCRVLGAYQYVSADAAFLYRPAGEEAWPDPTVLAATEGARLSQQLRQLAGGGRRAAARRLIEVPAAVAAARQRLAELAAQDEGEEDRGLEVTAEEASSASGGKVKKRRGRRLAGRGKKPRKPALPYAKGQPRVGSYEAALLRAFDDSAARAAHAAARRAKQAAMQHNVDTARQVLRDTAVWAAAEEAEAP